MQQSNSVEGRGGRGDLGGRVLVSLPFANVCCIVYSPLVLRLSCPLKYKYPGDSRGTGYSCIKVRGRIRGIWVRGRRRGRKVFNVDLLKTVSVGGKIKWLAVTLSSFALAGTQRNRYPQRPLDGACAEA